MKRIALVFSIVAVLLLADGAYLVLTDNQVGGDQGALFGNGNVVLSAGTTVLIAGGFLAVGSMIMWILALRRQGQLSEERDHAGEAQGKVHAGQTNAGKEQGDQHES